jgi:hypothetical protein
MRAQELEEARVRAEEVTKEFIQGTRQQAKLEERRAAAMALARYVNQEFGDAAEQLGISLRAGRGLAYVLQLIFEGDMQLQRTGLMILANLASDAFDPKSGETKRQVFNANIFHRIKDFVFAADDEAEGWRPVDGGGNGSSSALSRWPPAVLTWERFLERLVPGHSRRWLQPPCRRARSLTLGAQHM